MELRIRWHACRRGHYETAANTTPAILTSTKYAAAEPIHTTASAAAAAGRATTNLSATATATATIGRECQRTLSQWL